MSDPIDEANDYAARFTEAAQREQERKAGFAGKTIADSAWTCASCDEAIPQERRATLPGVQTCVVCQEGIEAEARMNKIKGK